MLGAGIGAAAGQAGHALFKTITGHGDYQVSENAILYNRDAVPKFTSKNPRCTIITHTEFIRDIRGSTSFAVDTFDISASNNSLFPWLSQIAKNYEQIVWQGLVFQFKTTSAMAVSSTNTALGTVVMATQYDVLEEQFINKQQMENREFSVSGSPSQSILHAIECDPKMTSNQGLYYIDLPSNSNNDSDPRLYNIGKFSIATVGMQAAATIGELWVSYKVCLMKPRIVANNNQSDQWIVDVAAVDGLNPFGDSAILTSSSTSSVYNNLDNFNWSNLSDQSFTSLKFSPWESTIDATGIFINPSFQGQLLIVYQIHGSSALPVTEPVFNTVGNVALISTAGDNVGFTYYKITGSAVPALNADGFHAVALFQCNGGYVGANGPRIQLSGAVQNGPSYCNVSIFATANNLRKP